MKRGTIINAATSALLAFTTGCSLFASSHQTVTVNCTEPQAKVWVNGNYVGEAPVESSVMRNHTVTIKVTKDGFEPTTKTIAYSFSTTGVLDAIGTGLFVIPVAGLLSPGSRKLEETSITVNLSPDKATTSPAEAKPASK